MKDRFTHTSSGFSAPAADGFAIVPDDAADLAEVTRALYIGASGDLRLVLAGGSEITFATLGAGTLLPVRARRVKATGTTAAGIVGLV